MTRTRPVKETISFGPFQLITSERKLTKDGVPITLGARAFDILVALMSTPNEIISKADLIGRVWPGIVVEEVSLRFHVAGLRKALGDGQNGVRYISTSPGHGYSFVAPLSRTIEHVVEPRSHGDTHLPAVQGIVGRDTDLLRLSDYLMACRFVTVAGPGGIGKTTLAAAVGHHLIDAFEGAILFVDFGSITEPGCVPNLILSALGMPIPPLGAQDTLLPCLRERRMLLILDTCEHLIGPIADLASRLYVEARGLHILATSRETFRSEGEHVFWLDPLACPPEDVAKTADIVLSFPATRLFVDRAVASGASLDLDGSDAGIISSMCRRLEGVPLAIELAARRVETFGLLQTANILDTHLKMFWSGTRTAPPRQRTLRATLEWSYSLLSQTEATVLRRLAGFTGPFTLQAALGVATCQAINEAGLFDAIDSLVAKSLIVPPASSAFGRFRLLDTTRAFALDKLGQVGELDLISGKIDRFQQGTPLLTSRCG